MLAAGKRVSIKGRLLIKEALNVDNYKGIIRLIKAVLFMTFFFELLGMLLSFPVFEKIIPFWDALGTALPLLSQPLTIPASTF